MRVVVCDTGPVLHLREANALKLLERAGEIIVPVSVDRELEARAPGWSDERPVWLRVVLVPEQVARQAELWRAIGGLGLGEAEAIALARSLPSDWLLTDDASARVFASVLGLEVHGSLGVLLWAAASGHLQRDEAVAILDRLSKSSLWISPRILNEASQALGQLFR